MKEASTKEETLYEALGQAKLLCGYISQNSVTSGRGKEGSGGRDNWEGAWGNVWVGKVWNPDGVCNTEAYAFAETQGILYLGFVHFTVCNFYLKNEKTHKQILNSN